MSDEKLKRAYAAGDLVRWTPGEGREAEDATVESVELLLRTADCGLRVRVDPDQCEPHPTLFDADLKVGEFVLTWHPSFDDGVPVEIPLGEPWVLPGTDVRVGEFRLSTREVPGGEEATRG